MKTSKMQTKPKPECGTTAKMFISVAAVLMLVVFPAISQENDDHLFPQRGKTALTLATGIPYLGIADYTYGVSNRFAVGIVAGSTPIGPGFGLRPRGILYQKRENFRIHLKSPLLYYPKDMQKGKDPWLLAWPTISGEWRANSGTRWSAGGGVVGAACVNELFGSEAHDRDHHEGDPPHHPHPEGGSAAENEIMSGVWNTVHAGVTTPVNDRLVFQSEVSLVMDGIKVAGDDWVGGPPVILVIGVTYTF